MTLAQSTLPAASPTVAPATTLPGAGPATAIVAARASHPATVSYVEGRLQIVADNSSLNQILREISRLTGMKITGGVIEQRVFGNYGPAPPTDILAVLLDGTGSNMLLLNNSSNPPAELILTPRQGGPTPPSPSASGFDDSTASRDNYLKPPRPSQRPAVGANEPPTEPIGRSAFDPIAAQNSPLGSAATGADSGTNPPSVDAGDPTSPNGVKTPQQIYQQLQQLQRAPPHQ